MQEHRSCLWQTVRMGRREDNRAQNEARILAAARAQIAEHGGGGLSMRAVAREVGMVSSAVYRYFPTREALLTAMIVASYGHLAAALEETDGQARGRRPDRRWAALADALRGWALEHPHEFQLIYGTPIPGYVAPPETIPAAAAVARSFLEAGAARPVDGFGGRTLTAQLRPLADETGVDPSGAAAVLAELAALVGVVGLELAGHLVGTADPADHLVEAMVWRQVRTLGLREAPTGPRGA